MVSPECGSTTASPAWPIVLWKPIGPPTKGPRKNEPKKVSCSISLDGNGSTFGIPANRRRRKRALFQLRIAVRKPLPLLSFEQEQNSHFVTPDPLQFSCLQTTFNPDVASWIILNAKC